MSSPVRTNEEPTEDEIQILDIEIDDDESEYQDEGEEDIEYDDGEYEEEEEEGVFSALSGLVHKIFGRISPQTHQRFFIMSSPDSSSKKGDTTETSPTDKVEDVPIHTLDDDKDESDDDDESEYQDEGEKDIEYDDEEYVEDKHEAADVRDDAANEVRELIESSMSRRGKLWWNRCSSSDPT